MKANEFTSMSKEQLTEKVAELKKDLFTLRFQLATGQLQNTMQITAVKRDIARAKTVLRQLEQAAMSETNNTQERGLRKTRIGVVVSDKMDKTVTIQIKTRVRHPLYGKIMNQTSKLKVHDENNECGVGDTIRVMETRPLSHDKRWRLVEIIEKAK